MDDIVCMVIDNSFSILYFLVNLIKARTQYHKYVYWGRDLGNTQSCYDAEFMIINLNQRPRVIPS